jgi:hypothetical protein
MHEEIEGGGMGEVASCGNGDEEEKEKGPAEIMTRSEHNERTKRATRSRAEAKSL